MTDQLTFSGVELLPSADGWHPEPWPASSRNGGRHQIGTLAGFASEWVAGFRRNPQR